MTISSKTPLTSQLHLQQQQSNGHYHYYSAIQPFVPFQDVLVHMEILNVEIMGAVIIERHFDTICKCYQVPDLPSLIYSAIAIRTTTMTKLPSPHSNPQLLPFLGTTGARPFTWYTQGLPFMNKTSWPKLYAAAQSRGRTDSAPLTQPVKNLLSSKIKGRFTSYANVARMLHSTPSQPIRSAASPPPTWQTPTPDHKTNRPDTVSTTNELGCNTDVALSCPSDLFRTLLTDKTDDPQALAVQDCLYTFISRSVLR
jgi:hypothetical protein